MPNYYIQATRGHFNPLSFDELVKPLNMYKEYYDENEKAITEMRSQADLWNEIMKSEGNTDLANKYNQYSQNLNDAAQQLANGMSYNLRKQIQDLRAQSSMVKQIENAYTLRAKDIDTYNKLMLKDPSRIGAYDPSRRSLNDYMQGPVTNEYGVSGDELYEKGAIAGQAYTSRSKKTTDSIKDGVITTTTTIGLTNDEINQELNNPNSNLHKEAEKILQAQGITPNMSYYNEAKQEILKGIIDGISYDKQKSYHNLPRESTNPNNVSIYASSENSTIYKSKTNDITIVKPIKTIDDNGKDIIIPFKGPLYKTDEISKYNIFKDDLGCYYLIENEGDFKSTIELNEDGVKQIKDLISEFDIFGNKSNINYIINGSGYKLIKEPTRKTHQSQIRRMNGDLSQMDAVSDAHELFSLTEDINSQFGEIENNKIPKSNYVQVGDKIIIYSNDKNIIMSFDYDYAKDYVDNPDVPTNIKYVYKNPMLDNLD